MIATGTVDRLNLPRGFGFITAPSQPDVFFHFRDLAAELSFDEQLLERRVQFEIVSGDKGPRAIDVKPVE